MRRSAKRRHECDACGCQWPTVPPSRRGRSGVGALACAVVLLWITLGVIGAALASRI